MQRPLADEHFQHVLFGESGEEVGIGYGQQTVVPVLGKKLNAVLFGAMVDADGLAEAANADIELAFGVRFLREERLELVEGRVGFAAGDGQMQFGVEAGVAVDLVLGQRFFKPRPARLVEKVADLAGLRLVEAAIALQHQLHALAHCVGHLAATGRSSARR